jgi:predicted component of type VI protein secretion system
MKKSIRMLFAAMAVTLAGATTADAQTAADVDSSLDALFGAHVPYRQFFENLQKAVASNDKATVAAMVNYPFQARIQGKALKIRDAAHFIADYDAIVTTKVKQSVAHQSYATLFANWQGVSIGDGEIWFSGVGDSNVVKITAVND